MQGQSGEATFHHQFADSTYRRLFRRPSGFDGCPIPGPDAVSERDTVKHQLNVTWVPKHISTKHYSPMVLIGPVLRAAQRGCASRSRPVSCHHQSAIPVSFSPKQQNLPTEGTQ